MKSYLTEKLILNPKEIYNPTKKQLAVLEKDQEAIKKSLASKGAVIAHIDKILSDICNSGFGMHLGKRLLDKYHICTVKEAKDIYKQTKEFGKFVETKYDDEFEDFKGSNYVIFVPHVEFKANNTRGSIHDMQSYIKSREVNKIHTIICFTAKRIIGTNHDLHFVLKLINKHISNMKNDVPDKNQNIHSESYQYRQINLLAGQAENYLNENNAIKEINKYVKSMTKTYDGDMLGKATKEKAGSGKFDAFFSGKKDMPKNIEIRDSVRNIKDKFNDETEQKSYLEGMNYASNHHMM